MSNAWGVAGWAWSDGARLAANLVIVAAGVSASRALRLAPARPRRKAPVVESRVAARGEPRVTARPADGAGPPGAEAPIREILFLDDTWLIDKADARRELQDNRDDLEARPCRT